MKVSKKFAALFAAVLMVATNFSGAMPASAASAGSLTCGSYKASALVTSNDKYNGSALTFSTNLSTKFTYLYAAVFGTKVDKNGDTVKYVSGSGKEASNSISSGTDKLTDLTDSGGYYYKKVASAHVAKKDGNTDSISLGISN